MMNQVVDDNTVIAIDELVFSWSGASQPVLDIPSMNIQRAKHLFIQGESGCGKTTLLNLLSGINAPDSGTLNILGQSMNDMGALQRDRFRADHLGVIFQQFNLLPYLSVLENTMLPFYFSTRRRDKVNDLALSARSLLRELEISDDLFDRNALDLSVGQQQRIAVARALVGNPELVIADEPTSALDRRNRDAFIHLLFKLSTEHDCTLIFVSHDDQLATHFDQHIDLTELNRAYRGGRS
jgi:putative ABC transport system ATP-binding protein